MKNFLIGIGILIATTLVTYICISIGMIVLAIAVAVAFISVLMVWVSSFFMLGQKGPSIVTSQHFADNGTKTTVIDVEFSEVKQKGKK